jgi:hypothetical protein
MGSGDFGAHILLCPSLIHKAAFLPAFDQVGIASIGIAVSGANKPGPRCDPPIEHDRCSRRKFEDQLVAQKPRYQQKGHCVVEKLGRRDMLCVHPGSVAYTAF